MIRESPMERVRMPRNDQPVKNPFSADELKRIVAAARTQRDKAMVLCLLDSGCRISEFAAWRYGDLDLQTGAVHLGASSTKGRRARVVYLGGKARRELMKWVARLPTISTDTPLWQTASGQPLSPHSVREVIKRIGRAAKVSPCGPHRFRHTFAVTFLRNGGDVFSLQHLLGHADLEMIRRYVHLIDADLQAAHAKFGVVDRL